MRWTAIVLFLISALAFSACDTNNIYEKNIDIDKYIWKSDNKLSFTVDIQDTTTFYNIYINTRHADMYPFMNLWLLVNTTYADGTRQQKRIEIPLATDEGAWYGEGMGDIWDRTFMIQESAVFKKPGTYTFELEQNMRQDPLPGIMAMGLRIEKTGIPKK